MLPSLLGVSNASLVAVIYVQNAKETDLFALFNRSLNIPIQVRRRYSHVHSVSETRQAGSKGLESLIMPLLYIYIYIYIYIYRVALFEVIPTLRAFIWKYTYPTSSSQCRVGLMKRSLWKLARSSVRNVNNLTFHYITANSHYGVVVITTA